MESGLFLGPNKQRFKQATHTTYKHLHYNQQPQKTARSTRGKLDEGTNKQHAVHEIDEITAKTAEKEGSGKAESN